MHTACTPEPSERMGVYGSSMLPNVESSYKDFHFQASSQSHSYSAAGDVCNTGSRYISRLPGTAGKKVVPRISMDSHASSTPEAMMMMMSPGMTALLQRYTEGTRTSVTPPLFSDGNAAQLLEIGRGATPGLHPPKQASPAHQSQPRPRKQDPHTYPTAQTTPTALAPVPPSSNPPAVPASAAAGRPTDEPAATPGRPPSAFVARAMQLDLSDQLQCTDSPCPTPTLAAAPTLAANLRQADPATPGSTLRHMRSMEHNRLLADRYAQLEDLWVESGQAALTPPRSRAAGIPVLTIPAAAAYPSASVSGAPMLSVPPALAYPSAQEGSGCSTPGATPLAPLAQTPTRRGRSAPSQIPGSPGPRDAPVVVSGYDLYLQRTASLSMQASSQTAAAAAVAAAQQQYAAGLRPTAAAGPAAASLSLRMSQLHLAGAGWGGGPASPSSIALSPTLAKAVTSRHGGAQNPPNQTGLAASPQHQLRSSIQLTSPSAKGESSTGVSASMDAESVSSLIVKSAAQGAAVKASALARTARAANSALPTTPGRSSSRVAARYAAAILKPVTPGRTPPSSRQPQVASNAGRTGSSNTANHSSEPAAGWGKNNKMSPPLPQRQPQHQQQQQQQQQPLSTRAATARFSAAESPDEVMTDASASTRRNRQSTPGPGKRSNQLHPIPLSPVSSPSPSPSPPPFTSTRAGTHSPQLGASGRQTGQRGAGLSRSVSLPPRSSPTPSASATAQQAQQQPRGVGAGFASRSRPATPHSAATSSRCMPMDIDDDDQEDRRSSSPYLDIAHRYTLHPRDSLGEAASHPAASGGAAGAPAAAGHPLDPDGAPPVTPPPGVALPGAVPGDSLMRPDTVTPPAHGAAAGVQDAGSLTPNTTTSLWCDVPATPGGRRMSPGTSQLLSLAFGSDYAPLHMGLRAPVRMGTIRALHLPARSDLLKQQAAPPSSVSPPSFARGPRRSDDFMSKLLKTNTVTATNGNGGKKKLRSSVGSAADGSPVTPTGLRTSLSIASTAQPNSSGKHLRSSSSVAVAVAAACSPVALSSGVSGTSFAASLMSRPGSSGGKVLRSGVGSAAAAVSSPAACTGEGRTVAVLRPCREDEWSQLSSYIMHKLSCQQLNQQMASAYAVVEGRCRSQTGMGRCASLTLSMEDLTNLGNTTATAKLIINAMVKLKRCAISSAGDRPGVMEYRVPGVQDATPFYL
ncbi:MAG: hypothetical protein WDW36_004227 [Sanguina aurantia]